MRPKIDTCNWCGKEKEVEWIPARTEFAGEYKPICKDCRPKFKK